MKGCFKVGGCIGASAFGLFVLVVAAAILLPNLRDAVQTVEERRAAEESRPAGAPTESEISDATRSESALPFREEAQALDRAIGCRNGKITPAEAGFGALYGCIQGRAETAKLFVNEEVGTGRVKNVKVMWNDWTKDIGYGLHADRPEAERMLQAVLNRYAPARGLAIQAAYFNREALDTETDELRLEVKHTQGPAIDEHLLTITPKTGTPIPSRSPNASPDDDRAEHVIRDAPVAEAQSTSRRRASPTQAEKERLVSELREWYPRFRAEIAGVFAADAEVQESLQSAEGFRAAAGERKRLADAAGALDAQRLGSPSAELNRTIAVGIHAFRSAGTAAGRGDYWGYDRERARALRSFTQLSDDLRRLGVWDSSEDE